MVSTFNPFEGQAKQHSLRQTLEEPVLARRCDGLGALGGIGQARPWGWCSSLAQRLLELEGRFKMVESIAK